jgi:hypothetical protein
MQTHIHFRAGAGCPPKGVNASVNKPTAYARLARRWAPLLRWEYSWEGFHYIQLQNVDKNDGQQGQLWDFSLRHRVQTGSGAPPASYQMGTGGKAAGA